MGAVGDGGAAAAAEASANAAAEGVGGGTGVGGVDGGPGAESAGSEESGHADGGLVGFPETKKKPDLSSPQMTATEFLLVNSNAYNLSGRLDPLTSPGNLSAGMSLDSKNQNMPSAALSAQGGVDTPKSASLSVGYDLLRFAKRFEDRPEGTVTTDTVEGSVGPVRGFYEQSSQPGNQDSRTTAYGADLSVGPLNFYGERIASGQDVVNANDAKYFNNPRFDNQTDRLGVRGSVPLGQGTLTGGVERQFSTDRYPQHSSQDARPTAQGPNVTMFDAGYEGQVGPGILGLAGGLMNVRNVGTTNRVDGSYDVPNPFGLGGNLSARGSYVNPINEESAAEAGMRYRVPL
tara:strand:- start:378 stop:1418 length:1041 start_codon:yes stop_codon:yes gene_type:complete